MQKKNLDAPIVLYNYLSWSVLTLQVLGDAKNKASEQYSQAGGVASEALGSIRTVASLCGGKYPKGTYLNR